MSTPSRSTSKSRRHKSRVSIDFFGEISFSNFLDWVVCVALAGILLYVVGQMGGVRPETTLHGLMFLAMLLPVHALLLQMRSLKGDCKVSAAAALGLPGLLLLLMQWLTGQSDAAAGMGDLALWTMAALVTAFACHCGYERNQTPTLLSVLVVVTLGCGFLAFKQVFRGTPELPPMLALVDPGLGRFALDPLYQGRASGMMSTPDDLGVLMLLVAAPMLVLAMIGKQPGVVRVFCGYIAFLAIGCIILTFDFSLLVCLMLTLIIVPFFARIPLKKTAPYFVTIAVLWAVYLYLGARYFDQIHNCLDGSIFGNDRVLFNASTACALDVLAQNPLFGDGADAVWRHFEAHRPAGFYLTPSTAPTGLLALLSERGILGTLFILAPVVFSIVCGFQVWNSLPDAVLPSNASHMSRASKDGRVPLRKLILASVILGQTGMLLGIAVANPLETPGLVLLMALFSGILLRYSNLPCHELGENRQAAFGWLMASGVLMVLLPLFFFQGMLSNVYADEAERRLRPINEQAEKNSYDLEQIADCETLCLRALDAAPFRRAHTILGRLHLFRAYAVPRDRNIHGKAALESFEEALKDDNLNPWNWIGKGTALWMLGSPDTALDAYRKAVELAPRLPQAWYFMAACMVEIPQYRQESIQAIDAALKLAPLNLAPYNELKRKLSLK